MCGDALPLLATVVGSLLLVLVAVLGPVSTWQRPGRRGKLSSRLPQLFCGLLLYTTADTLFPTHEHTLPTDWLSATPHGIIEPLSTAYLSSRRLQPHMCHGSEPVVTACSYFPQLLTIALYLRDSIWSKLDSFILLCFGRAGYLTPLGGALLNIHWREGETAHARTDAVLHAYSWMDRDVFSNSCRRMYIFDSAQVCH